MGLASFVASANLREAMLVLPTMIAIACPTAAYSSQSISEVHLLHDAWTFKDGARNTCYLSFRKHINKREHPVRNRMTDCDLHQAK